jgi:predicted HAD superfamily Cof-like phosphohydrolase
MGFVEKVKLFNEIAGTKEQFDKRKAAMYVGLIYEELAEMLDSFGHDDWLVEANHLHDVGMNFKKGDYDYVMDTVDRVEFLDAAVDIAVVALGAGIAIGADVAGACDAVADNNLEKFPLIDGVHTVLKDDNGKVKKPEGYKSVELNSFVK